MWSGRKWVAGRVGFSESEEGAIAVEGGRIGGGVGVAGGRD